MPLHLTDNAKRVLETRYLLRDDSGQITESADELFRRVARGVARAEDRFGGGQVREHWEQEFLQLMLALDFLPNSPTLMNAGTSAGQLSACFVLPVEDSMEGIFEALKLMALIQRSGGGTGFSFSRLRPRGDLVSSTKGTASGPVSFMRIFDCATENIRLGGRRRGANMGVLRVDHPDVIEFVEAKLDGVSFRNFNLSVAASDQFMQAVEVDGSIALYHPKSRAVAKTFAASELMSRIARAAHQSGDPGMVFVDTINRSNPTPALGRIEATNPCGEVPLLAYEACNLGSINLSHMVRQEGSGFAVDWPRLARTVRVAVRFLDDVIEVNQLPAPEIEKIVRGNRKIGLGVMGFAELLLLLGVPYASTSAISVADELMRFVAQEADAASAALADERGVFPNWPQSDFASQGQRFRNATRTSIAPTGTIGIIAGTTAGIEPLFALAYRRQHVLDEQTLVELNPVFLRYARQHGLYNRQLIEQLCAQGTLAGVPGIPPDVRELFRTALEIEPEHHLLLQAAFQKHVDNAVSKTINLPHATTPDEIAAIYRRAWALGLKGITVYRYGSKGQQVLSLGTGQTSEEREHFATCDPHACKL